MSFFDRDLKREQLLLPFLDDVYKKLNYDFKRVTDLEAQHKGIDVAIDFNGRTYYIDEKSQLSYLNKDLPTFTFELSYLKNDTRKKGWLFDADKVTTHYFLVTGIMANDANDLSKGFESLKITSVNRNKLQAYLTSIGLTEARLTLKHEEIIAKHQKKLALDGLDFKTEGCLVYSPQLSEQPVNIQFRLRFLIDKGIGKRIFPLVG